MSDKTKHYAELDRIDRTMAAQRAREAERARRFPRPRCLCGFTAYEVETLWAYQPDRWTPLRVYCPVCLPADLRAELGIEQS